MPNLPNTRCYSMPCALITLCVGRDRFVPTNWVFPSLRGGYFLMASWMKKERLRVFSSQCTSMSSSNHEGRLMEIDSLVFGRLITTPASWRVWSRAGLRKSSRPGEGNPLLDRYYPWTNPGLPAPRRGHMPAVISAWKPACLSHPAEMERLA
jgi:hypothetical protein